MLLDELPTGTPATVQNVACDDVTVGDTALQRLSELGFIPGEPVEIVRRGPGGREPLAVLVGNTLIALRKIEARCVRVITNSGPLE